MTSRTADPSPDASASPAAGGQAHSLPLDPLALCNQGWDLTAAAAAAIECGDVEHASELLEQRRPLIATLGEWIHAPAGQTAPAATRRAVRDWIRRLLASDEALDEALRGAVAAMRQERSALTAGKAALGSYGSSSRVRPEAEYIDRRR